MGDYYAERFDSNRMLRSGRGSLFTSLTSTIPLWQGSTAELSPLAAYRYSPVAVVPGVSLTTNVNGTVALYGAGEHQESISFSGGPTLTLGTFSKPFLDFTRFRYRRRHPAMAPVRSSSTGSSTSAPSASV